MFRSGWAHLTRSKPKKRLVGTKKMNLLLKIRVTRQLQNKFAKFFKEYPKKLPSQKRPKYLQQSSI